MLGRSVPLAVDQLAISRQPIRVEVLDLGHQLEHLIHQGLQVSKVRWCNIWQAKMPRVLQWTIVVT
jgi:hypothetical protein